jgi:hypothetical protein
VEIAADMFPQLLLVLGGHQLEGLDKAVVAIPAVLYPMRGAGEFRKLETCDANIADMKYLLKTM